MKSFEKINIVIIYPVHLINYAYFNKEFKKVLNETKFSKKMVHCSD